PSSTRTSRMRSRRSRALRLRGRGLENLVDLASDFLVRHALCERELLDQKSSCGVEHLALAERQRLAEAQHAYIAQHLGDLEDRARLDPLHVLAIAAIPRLRIARHVAGLEDRVDIFDLLGVDQ